MILRLASSLRNAGGLEEMSGRRAPSTTGDEESVRETTSRRLPSAPARRPPRTRDLRQRAAGLHARHTARLLRFALVGGAGVLVNYAILAGLVELGHLPRLLAAALATEGAILSNFTLNNSWTFGDVACHHSLPARAARYNFFALGGLLISVAVLGVLVYVFGLYYLIANLFAIGAATLWNYAANARWTWRLDRD